MNSFVQTLFNIYAMKNTNTQYYTLLLVPAAERWPEPGKSFIKLKVDDLISRLSLTENSKQIEIIKHTFSGFNSDDNTSVPLRVVDQRLSGHTVYAVVKVPNFGNIEINVDDCEVVKPVLGVSTPIVRNANADIPANEKLATELSIKGKNVTFQIIKDIDTSENTLFDSYIITEYTTIVYNEDAKNNDVDEEKSDDDDNKKLDVMTIYDIDDNDVVHFKRRELLQYNTVIAAMFVSCIENYVDMDDELVKNAVQDFQSSYASLDLSIIFKSLRTFKNFLNSDLL